MPEGEDGHEDSSFGYYGEHDDSSARQSVQHSEYNFATLQVVTDLHKTMATEAGVCLKVRPCSPATYIAPFRTPPRASHLQP